MERGDMIEKGIRLGTMTLADLEKSGGFDAAVRGFCWFYLGAEFCENLLGTSVCEEAVRLLLAVVQRPSEAPQHRRLETRLIVRGSTGPVPVQHHEEVAGAND